MKTAITIIAICEVIRTIQITIDLAVGVIARKKVTKKTLESINKVGDSVADEFTPDKVARAIIDEVAESEGDV